MKANLFAKRLVSRTALLVEAAALCVCSTTAMAAVIDSPITNVAVPATTSGIYINVVTGTANAVPASSPGWDLNPWGSTQLSFFSATPSTSHGSVLTGVGGTINPLAVGATVSAANSFGTTQPANGSGFRGAQDAYMGFRFLNENTGVINYGYARLTTSLPAGHPAVVICARYENTGAAITVAACGPAVVDTAPTLTYNPTTAAGVTFPTGLAGSVNATIAITSAGAVGTGQSAVTNCAITGPGAASFGAVTTTPANGIFNSGTTTGSINLSCTRGAAVASASLACTETATPAVAGSPFTRTWALTCPAATLVPDINVSPLALNSTQLAGSSVTLPLNIGNVGQAPLNWTIAETLPDRPAATNAVAAPEPVFNVPAAVTSAKDCEAFANYPFSEPAGWAEFCDGTSAPSAAAPGAPTSTGFLINLRAPDRNLKRFILNNFPGQTVVGAQAANIYGMDFDSTATTLHVLNVSTNQLGTVNTTTGAFTSTVACAAPAGGTWTGLSIDPVTNAFYASTTVNLYTLDPATCAPILVGPFGVAGGLMIDIAINASGAMYGHDIATDSIYSINRTTGAATLIGPTGIAANFAQGMDFDNETGTLYIFAYIGTGANRYGTVNLTTGAVTALASDNPLGEFEGATQTLGTCQPNDYSWLSVSPAAGTTAAGASTVANVTFNAAGLACGATYTAQLCVRSDDPNAGPGNGTNLVPVPVSMTVNCAADLSMTLTDTPDPVTAGTNLTYVATLTNNGPSDAQDATITLPLPAGTTFVSATPSAGGVCNAASPVVCTWAGATAAAGVRSATIVAAVAASQTAGLSATATASSLTTDPNPANNSATATTGVITSADLLLTFTASATQTLINVPVTFTATSLNQGPSDAQNVSITVTLTPDFRYSGHSATGATCTTPQVGTTGSITCTWAGATAPGVTRTLVVVAFSNVEGLTGVNASTTSTTTDPNPANNIGNLTVQVGYLVEEIPTLSSLGLLLMGLMIGLIGFVAVRRQA